MTEMIEAGENLFIALGFPPHEAVSFFARLRRRVVAGVGVRHLDLCLVCLPAAPARLAVLGKGTTTASTTARPPRRTLRRGRVRGFCEFLAAEEPRARFSPTLLAGLARARAFSSSA